MNNTSDKQDNKPEAPVLRDPQIRKPRWRVPLVWLVPLVAALIGLSMIVHTWLSTGPQITIQFQSAAGLEAGKTLVKYKDVAIGTVTAINLNEDQSQVLVVINLEKSAENFARADTRFWVVRPRVGAGGVSGIDTLLSGAYIGVDKGKATESQKSFIGLEIPPTVISGTLGKTFSLHSDSLGSLDIGSPVYFRHIQVGRIASYKLDDNGSGVGMQVFVDAPYDRFVMTETRFWNASGLDVSLGANGLNLKTQSLATVIAGGIAFETPTVANNTTPANDKTRFVLALDRQTAMAPPDGAALRLQMRFEQPLRGLAVNAPVEFRGMTMGRVTAINLDYNPVKKLFPVIVDVEVYPDRLASVRDKFPMQKGNQEQQVANIMRGMVEHGLRAQARTGNVLTGQLYITLDFIPNVAKVDFDVNAKPLQIPTVAGDFDKLQEQIASIVAKIDKVPFDKISQHLDQSLVSLDQTLKQLNGGVLPQVEGTLREAQQTFNTANSALSEDGPLQENLGKTLTEVQRSARSLRTLTDLLGRNPEALIRGRPSETAPAAIPDANRNGYTEESPR